MSADQRTWSQHVVSCLSNNAIKPKMLKKDSIYLHKSSTYDCVLNRKFILRTKCCGIDKLLNIFLLP